MDPVKQRAHGSPVKNDCLRNKLKKLTSRENISIEIISVLFYAFAFYFDDNHILLSLDFFQSTVQPLY